MTMTLPPPTRVGIAAASLLVAVALLWLGATTHLKRACMLMDTPYLPLCHGNEAASDNERQANLRTHLAVNPGDSRSWIRLANIERGAQEQALLRAVSTLAPTDPNVLMWRAGAAFTVKDFEAATLLLVQLVEYRQRREAADALARLLASGEGTALLRPHLVTASRWLPQVMTSMTTLRLPLTTALPLLVEASAKRAAPPSTIQAYIRALKTDGKWADAYGLWLSQQEGPTPLLYNGTFELPFQSDGFDWEVTPTLPSRTGAAVNQKGSQDRGRVLEVEFTGKLLVVPVIRQYVFLYAGRYVFRGQYMASKLRTDQGLAWAVRCINTKSTHALAGRSDGLLDTGGVWRSFQFEITVPGDCGLVASLQLETFASSEAAAGVKGRAAFDSFELRRQTL